METKLKERPRFDDVLSRFVVAPEAAEVPEIVPAVVIPKPKRKVSPRLSVPQSTLILANAKMNGWEDVRKVGQGDMIDRPIETNGWLVMPIEMYTGIIPPEAIQHAEILTMGVQIKGLLVADDIQHVERQSQTMPLAAPSVSPDWEKIGVGLGKVALVIAIGTAMLAVLPLVLGVAGVGAALAYDPLLIAVTQENEWIVCHEWWDE